jgi:hypothetical protein
MRTMLDKKGLELRIHHIEGYDAYDGMLEGTPWLVRRLRIRQGQLEMSQTGQYVDGIALLERELTDEPRGDNWPPNEQWTARLVTLTEWGASVDKGTHTEWPGHRHAVVIHWYQEGGDPMSRLAEIVAGLDFMRYSVREDVSMD